MTETHWERENITRKVNKKLLQQIIMRKGYLLYYDTKVINS